MLKRKIRKGDRVRIGDGWLTVTEGKAVIVMDFPRSTQIEFHGPGRTGEDGERPRRRQPTGDEADLTD